MEAKDTDIVISGISGRFPKSRNLKEFEYNLFNKVDMTDDDESRWSHFHDEVPPRFGKIPNLEKFDASFFSTLNKHASWIDPQMRILLEHSYEAILDAGVSPQSLVGTRTGVFIGCSHSDSKDAFNQDVPPKDGYKVLGNAIMYLANRLSYALGLCGPSFTVDTACSSSAYALDCAFRYLEAGLCDTALVGGSQLILSPKTAIEYSRIGLVSKDGISRPFDVDSNGFVRAETICVVFLQRRKDSKRIYANVVYSNSNNDGFKLEGSTFPSRIMQQKLMESFYKTIDFDPKNVNYVEAHATSTKLGDPEEMAAIDEVFNIKSKRSKTLTIGSVKSNIGHAESASAMSSLAKILVSFENQKILPNINIKTLRSDIPALAEGRIRVATEVEELQSEFIAMNSFGLGGGNAHSLFRGNSKVKVNYGIPHDDLGRMVLWSGRTEAAINSIFDDITQRPLDAEHIALLQNSQVQTTSANIYRGYGMFLKGEAGGNAVCVQKSIEYYNGTQRPVAFVYSGIGSQWLEMGRDLMRIPLFAQSIENCHNILKTKRIDLKSILTSSDEKTFDNVLHSYVGIVAIEIALTDILKELNIVPDYIIGHSVGELGCAYADNCFTAEETILTAYARGEANVESKTILGAMAAVGMSSSKLKEIIPDDIDIACHNADDSYTVSGPIKKVHAFVEQLKRNKIFAKEVACSGVPLHSRYIKEMGQNLRTKLKDIIKVPKARSKKWLSSTYAKDQWNQTDATTSSVEYHTNNLLNPVLFKEVAEMLPKDALMIEVAPSGLLRAILKRNLKEGIYVNLTEKNSKDGFNFFLQSIGRIFQHGVDLDVSKLYPSVNFPVSRGTPMISPLIKWNHDDNHYVPYFNSHNEYERHNVVVNISDKKFEVVQNHIVDGRVLFPAAGWIFLVWETFSRMIGAHYEIVKVIFENLHFLRATTLEQNQDILVTISIHRGSGSFEIIEGNDSVVKGTVKKAENIKMSNISPPEANENVLTTEDIYTESRLSGITLLGPFQVIKEMRYDTLKGKVKWLNNWITFFDSILHFNINKVVFSREVSIPTKIRKFVIDPVLHYNMIEEKIKQSKADNPDDIASFTTFDVRVCPYKKIINAGAVELHEKNFSRVPRRQKHRPKLEIYKFVPYFCNEMLGLDDASKVVIQLIFEKLSKYKLSVLEVDDTDLNDNQLLCKHIQKAFDDIPQLVSDITLITTKSDLNIKEVTIKSDDLSAYSGIDLLILNKCIGDESTFENIKSVLNINGFIVSRESQDFYDIQREGLRLVGRIRTASDEVLHILKLTEDSMQHTNYEIIEITSNVSDWLEPLKNSLKGDSTIIYAYNQETSGIVGFMNTLKNEYKGRIKCFFMMDTANSPPIFDIDDDFFREQLNLNYTVNIFKDGKWGSYRHLNIANTNNLTPQSNHCFADCIIKGDLSSLAWMEGPYDINDSDQDLINIQYSSLNFKDVMLALGRISPHKSGKVVEYISNLGLEFSGIKRNGKRVMGITTDFGAIATHFNARSKNLMLWNVPDSWTLEEAATVPLVYYTVYIAFFSVAKIQSGKKILIHSGSGGVGQAAIQVALAYGLEVFTTVGTEDKKNFLLKKFPKLKLENIGNSRDTSFEDMISDKTKGEGVDYVLNSLTGEKLEASIRCLGLDGVFIEIGKYDIQMGTNIDIGYLSKRITIKSVVFDDFDLNPDSKQYVIDLLNQDIKSGVVKPLNVTVFEANKIEEAFRFMTTGNHIGKVVLKIRQNENDEYSLPLSPLNRVYYNSNDCVIVIGGLGGVGIELVEWLILRGCRKLVLGSSRGVRTSRQAYKISIWESYGVKVIVSMENVATEEGCEELMKQSTKLGPIAAIYNLAGVLRDKLFDDLNERDFIESLAPKALATRCLDKVSRALCPNLKQFVVFSSIGCGRGSISQSNYSMANSIMERIIEERQHDGLAGKAIQWGPIGDVGMLAQSKNILKDFIGTIPQSILSCFDVLDTLLTSTEPIVASTIIADKKSGDSKKRNIIDVIFNIMGIQDKKSVSMDSSLTQLGIDSLTGVELQQTIEREFDISLRSQELRSLTLSQLVSKVSSKNSVNDSNLDVSTTEVWMALMIKGVIDENGNLITTDTIVKANDVEDNLNSKVLIIPGLIGYAANVYRNLANYFEYPAYILQMVETTECKTLDEIINVVIEAILNLFSNVDNFILLGHSFGTVLTLKIAKNLENRGKRGQIIQIDGSPKLCTELASQSVHDKNVTNINNYAAMILFDILKQNIDSKTTKLIMENNSSWEKRLKAIFEASGRMEIASFDKLIEEVFKAYTNRLNIAYNLKNEEFNLLKTTKISLIKATQSTITGLPEDYGLSMFSSQKLFSTFVVGDHVTIMENPDLSVIIKKLMST